MRSRTIVRPEPKPRLRIETVLVRACSSPSSALRMYHDRAERSRLFANLAMVVERLQAASARLWYMNGAPTERRGAAMRRLTPTLVAVSLAGWLAGSTSFATEVDTKSASESKKPAAQASKNNKDKK